MKQTLLWVSLALCACNTFDAPGQDAPFRPSSDGFFPPVGFGVAGSVLPPTAAGRPAPMAGMFAPPPPVRGGSGGRGWQPIDAGPPVVLDDGGVDDAGE